MKGYIKKPLILFFLILAGMLLNVSGLLDADKMLNIAREYADHWWFVLVLILLQIIMFTFALAGSFILWIAAPLYPPEIATFILAAGGTLGGISAYLFSKQLSGAWIENIEHSHIYMLLQKQHNFITLFAFRVFPAFPHSLINYSSGILKVKISHFIFAAIAGLSIKAYLYSSVIYSATSTSSSQDLLDISVYGPLLLISGPVLIYVFIKIKLTGKNE